MPKTTVQEMKCYLAQYSFSQYTQEWEKLYGREETTKVQTEVWNEEERRIEQHGITIWRLPVRAFAAHRGELLRLLDDYHECRLTDGKHKLLKLALYYECQLLL